MKTAKLGIALACSLTLAACGGGDDDASAASQPVAGLYEGSSGAEPASELLILASGRYYLVYGFGSASAAPAAGVVVGEGSANGTSFLSNNARDFDLRSHTLLNGTLTATVTPMTSASTAVVRSDDSVATYSGSYDTASAAGASLSALAGIYGGELAALAATQASVLNVDSSGVLAGTTTSGGCRYGGFATPHASGNVFDVTLNFQSGCTHAGSTLKGHAFLSGKVLYAVVLGGDPGVVTVFAGVKP